MHGCCYHHYYLKKGTLITQYKIISLGLKIQYNQMVKEDTPKVEGGSKPKGGRFQQPKSTQKMSFTAPTTILEDKVFN